MRIQNKEGIWKMQRIRKNSGRVLALLLSLMMLIGALPVGTLTAFAEGEDAGQVLVIVENTAYTGDDAPWSGILVEEWVELKSHSTMMSCVVEALEANGYSQVGAENNYIEEINGLTEFDGGPMSGWMGTLNDWFTNEGFGAFTAADGKLSAGDEIRIMYTVSYGDDLGGSWSNNDKTVKSLTFSAGELSPAFSKNTHEYTLSIPEGVNSLIVTPTASNKNYQVRTSVDDVEYKRTAEVPVTDNTVITVICGDPSWPSMNNDGGEAQVYTVTVENEPDEAAKQETENRKKAEEVMEMIRALGSVTRDSGTILFAARTAYDALTEEQKALVTNYSVLVETEKAYAELIKANEEFEKIYNSVGDYMVSLGTPDVGSVGGEWMAIGLARSGLEVPAGYYENVVKYVKEHINDKEQLHRAKSTDNARVILALTALGYDVINVGGHNLLAGLNDMSYIKKQGVNGPIWVLIAFDSHDYEIPAGDVTRDALINEILNAQIADGGWSLSGDEADPDMTAMAIQALASYYNTDANVKAAVDKALDRLSAMQTSAGGYVSWGTLNSESCAQVIVALTALGIDPQTDTRFIKNGCSVVDTLLSFYTDGGFRHTMDGEINGMATEQGYYALAAFARMQNRKTSLYDMSDVTIRTDVIVTPPDDEQKPRDENQSGDTSNSLDDGNHDGQTAADNKNQETQTTISLDKKDNVQNPQTGDTSNAVVYWGLMMTSFAGFVLTVARKRKEKQE